MLVLIDFILRYINLMFYKTKTLTYIVLYDYTYYEKKTQMSSILKLHPHALILVLYCGARLTDRICWGYRSVLTII